MPNWCSSAYAIEGDANEIKSLWKSHSTLPLLATQNYPFWLKYD